MSITTFLDLPGEILHDVLHVSREPNLIHVCRRTWKELPSFVWYSKRLTALAFYKPITDHVYSDMSIELFDRYKLPKLGNPLTDVERIDLQDLVFCSHWFTSKHLVKTTMSLMFSAIQEALKTLEVQADIQQMYQLQSIIRKFGQQWQNGQLNPSPSWGVRWKMPDQHFLMVIYTLRLLIKGPLANQKGQVVPPWRQEPQQLRAYALDIPLLPLNLIEKVGRHDRQSFQILQALYDVRIDNDSPPTMFAMTAETMKTIENCIQNLLRCKVDPSDPEDDHLRLLLLFDGMQDLDYFEGDSRTRSYRRTACSHKRKTPLEKTSVYIRGRFYEQVIGEVNIHSFKRLMKLNPAICLPQPSFFKTLFKDHEQKQSDFMKECRAIYLDAYEQKEAARKALAATLEESEEKINVPLEKQENVFLSNSPKRSYQG